MRPHPFDTRDAIEHAEIAALLEQLPAAHPTREAYGGRAGTLGLTHLVADRSEVVEGMDVARRCDRTHGASAMIVSNARPQFAFHAFDDLI